MLYITQSQDAEALFTAFIQQYRSQINDVFSEHTVIVPSMTIRDWLDNRITDTLGISTLFKAQFWGMFSWQLVERVTGDVHYEGHPPLTTAAMQWRMFAWFSTRLALNGGHTPSNTPETDTLLNRLCQGIEEDQDAIQQRLWLLASQFASIYTRYLNMRPEWLRLWSKGEQPSLSALLDETVDPQLWPDWQRAHYQHIALAQQEIWQQLFADVFQAREARLAQFWSILDAGEIPPHALPSTLFVYYFEGVDSDTINFLVELGNYIDIYVYHHSVSAGYIGDMVDDKWLNRLLIRGEGEDLHYDSVHPILSRFGKQQRSLFRLLQSYRDHPDYPQVTFITLEDEVHDTARTHNLLHLLQREIHDLNPNLIAAYQPQAKDRSLCVHACHGLMRQLEALRADIVAWLNADASRQPDDILIVLPELSTQQGIVNAVFPPASRYDGYYLPARLTGVTSPYAQNLWAALSGSFNLIDGRFDAESVLSWLHSDDVCAMLDIAPDTMQRITTQLINAGFRRGFDYAHIGDRLAKGDEDDRYTFCYALDRLAAGLIMPDAPIYADKIVPQYGITMHDAAAINALCRLANRWREQHKQRNDRYPIAYWLNELKQRLEQDFSHAINSEAFQTITVSLRDLESQLKSLKDYQNDGEDNHDAITPPPVALRFVLDDITSRLKQERVSSEPSGVMTIGTIGAMRALPYKLIAFVNANISDFPANPPDNRYDLIVVDRERLGDHRPEHDDLAALLDILLNAEQDCWIYYNAELNGETQLPSIPVQELIQYIESEQPALAPLTIEHTQDPFHADQSNPHPAPLWYSVRQALHQKQPENPFIALHIPEELPELPEQHDEHMLFSRLATQLLKPFDTLARSLDISFSSAADTLPILEPLILDNLTKYILNDTLIQNQYSDIAFARLPLLPAGASADIIHRQHQAQWAQRRADLLAHCQADALTSTTETIINIAGHHISASIPHPAAEKWLSLSPRSNKPKHIMRLWWQHLLWQACGGTGESVTALKQDIIRFKPVPDAQHILIDWLRVWHHSRSHLWLLPTEVGYHYTNPEKKTSLDKLIKAWRDESYPSDNQDAFTLLTRGYSDEYINELIQAHTERYAERLYAPLFQYL